MIIAKQYHKANYNPILCKEKKIIKETSEEGMMRIKKMLSIEEMDKGQSI